MQSKKKVLIVGGVAGGASCAARLRRVDELCEIIMFEKGEHISFANCGLPYYIGEVIPERQSLLVQTPKAMKDRFDIDVRVLQEVVEINKEEKKVQVLNHQTGETYWETYDSLVISPGAYPIKPPLQGIDAPNIFTLRNIPDTDLIKNYVDNKKPQRAVVIGGGFIGLEMAENLHHRGIEVFVVEMADQVMSPLDYDMAALVHEHIYSKDVKLIFQDGVKEFKTTNTHTEVILQSGRRLVADLVILAIGVKPDTHLATQAGLELGSRGGIKVNQFLQSSDPNIYAIGDAIEVKDFVTGIDTLIPLAGPANKQGRIVANNIAGRKEVYKGTQGTATVKVFDLTVATTGNNEKQLKKLNIPYHTTIIHPYSHATYYPGATSLSLKLIFGEDGKILGAQAVGFDKVEKRIDVLATAQRFGLTVYDLQELELAYAPPFSSAKDPVNMAGYVAGNILNGDVVSVGCDLIDKLDPTQAIILEVRDIKALEKMCYIPGSLLIPLDELRDRISEIPKDKEIYVICLTALRSYIACRILSQHGFKNVKNINGGWKTYATVNNSLAKKNS